MTKHFVRVLFDVKRCDHLGADPAYRLYLNDELFVEREWSIENSYYFEELMQISAPAGTYCIKLATVPPSVTEFKMSEFRVEIGPGRVIDAEHGIIEIYEN